MRKFLTVFPVAAEPGDYLLVMSDKPSGKKSYIVPIRFNAADYAEAKAFCGKEPLGPRMRSEFFRTIREHRKGHHPSVEELHQLEMRFTALLSKSGFPDAARRLSKAGEDGRLQLDEVEHAVLINACADLRYFRKRMMKISRITEDGSE